MELRCGEKGKVKVPIVSIALGSVLISIYVALSQQ